MISIADLARRTMMVEDPGLFPMVLSGSNSFCKLVHEKLE